MNKYIVKLLIIIPYVGEILVSSVLAGSVPYNVPNQSMLINNSQGQQNGFGMNAFGQNGVMTQQLGAPANTNNVPNNTSTGIGFPMKGTTFLPGLFGSSGAMLPSGGSFPGFPQQMAGMLMSNPKGERTCAEAFQQSSSNKNSSILDLSNTTDFMINGDNITKQFYEQIKKDKVNVIYVDLYNSEVPSTYLQKWSEQFKKDNIKVLWNIANNTSVNDQTISVFVNFDNIIGLNISNTSISDFGANQLVSMFGKEGISNIQFINICGTNISQFGIQQLLQGFNNHVQTWESKHPNEKYCPFKSGIIYDLGLRTAPQSTNSQFANMQQYSPNQTFMNNITTDIAQATDNMHTTNQQYSTSTAQYQNGNIPNIQQYNNQQNLQSLFPITQGISQQNNESILPPSMNTGIIDNTNSVSNNSQLMNYNPYMYPMFSSSMGNMSQPPMMGYMANNDLSIMKN